MSRSSVHEALVLSVRASGEANREAAFLTADAGIVRAVVFGGAKSKLRAHAAPFNSGTLYLYRDPVRDSRKVVDFDVRSWRPGLRESLERSRTASAVCETILASHGGGGGWDSALGLALDTLDAQEIADDEAAQRSLVRFLWKWADHLGSRPEAASCACGAGSDEVLWFFPREGLMLCGGCAEGEGGDRFAVPAGARAWLAAVDSMDARAALRVAADAAPLAQARRLASAAVAEALGRRLALWDGFDPLPYLRR